MFEFPHEPSLVKLNLFDLKEADPYIIICRLPTVISGEEKSRAILSLSNK